MNIKNTSVCTVCSVSPLKGVLNKHRENCMEINGVQAIKMPTNKCKILKFNNFNKQQPVPFVIYADFEAITEKISGCQQKEENHSQKPIRNTLTVDMDIRSYVVTMISTANQNKFTEVKKLFINLWKLC